MIIFVQLRGDVAEYISPQRNQKRVHMKVLRDLRGLCGETSPAFLEEASAV
jgi:hypothetical protein